MQQTRQEGYEIESTLEGGSEHTNLMFYQSEGLSFYPLSDEDEATFIESVAREIGRRYPETGEQYPKDILSAARGQLRAFASTSLAKVIVGCYSSKHLLGFTVVTPKKNRSIKFGPTIVLPHARGRHVARLIRKVCERHYIRSGFEHAYSTCQEGNLPASTYVRKCGYRLVAVMRDQYLQGTDELVYYKRLPSASPSSKLPEIGVYSAEAIQSFKLERKRGGSIKVQLGPHGSTRAALEVLDYAVELAGRENAHRIYLETPRDPIAVGAAKRLAFQIETLGPVRPGERIMLGRSLVRHDVP